MTTAPRDARRDAAPSGPALAMASELRRYWRDAAGYQRFAYAIGALLVLSGVFHAGVFAVSGGAWEGPVSWRKAVTFGLSFGITTVSVAWVMTFLPRRRLAGWLLMGLFGVANLAEVGAVTMQAWRRQPSHFNISSAFDAAVFVSMAVSVAAIALVIVAVTAWCFRSLEAPRSLALAIRCGLVLLVASQALGYAIIDNGLGILEEQGVDTPAATARDLSHFGEAGAMKVPHALTIHGLQVLPALAWLAQFAPWSERRRVRMLATAASGYVGLCLLSGWQAFHGEATTALTPGTTGLLAVSVVLLVAALAATLGAVARASRPQAA